MKRTAERRGRSAEEGGEAVLSVIDRVWRIGLFLAWRAMKVYWFFRRPTVAGVVVLVRAEGRILLVEHSYRSGLCPPGGFHKRGEDAATTGSRELEEELSLSVDPSRLRCLGSLIEHADFRTTHTTVMELDCATTPKITVDGREVVRASWYSTDPLPQKVWPPLVQFLESHPLGSD